MAKITLLHWNVQCFAPKKIGNELNAAGLINYIAWVVGQTQANIISLLEVRNRALATVLAQLIPAIDLVNGESDLMETRWKAATINSGKNFEAYVVLYQEGNKFTPLMDKKTQIFNLTDQAAVTEKEGSLEFNCKRFKYGGRMPFYVAFETNEEKKFTVIATHIMFSEKIALRESGIESVGKVAQNKQVLYKGKATDLAASLTAGDFNVHYSSGHPGAYLNLLDLPAEPATSDLTTLINTLPLIPLETSEDYRVNAYDNIFLYKRKDPPDKVDGEVLDLIDDSTKKPRGSGLLADPTNGFEKEGIREPYGEEIQNIPPKDYQDSWRIVKNAISDHLPVVLTFEL